MSDDLILTYALKLILGSGVFFYLFFSFYLFLRVKILARSLQTSYIGVIKAFSFSHLLFSIFISAVIVLTAILP